VSQPKSVPGGCLCGAIRFEAELPSKWCAHCHCSMCRRAHGAGFVTWAGFESSRFRVIRGADQLAWYTSSAGARRGFCPVCGSTMLFESERWPGETHVALGCLDGPIDRRPQANVFFDAHVDWMPIDEDLKNIPG
jgi:hypothetical protein